MKPFLLTLAILAPQVLVPVTAHAQTPQVLEVAPENALKYLQEARAAFVPYEREPTLPEEMRRVVEQNSRVVPLLQRAVALPLTFEVKGFSEDEDQFKMMSSVRAMARFLVLRGDVLASAGDLDGALESNLLAVALGIKFQESGPLISSLVGNAVEAIGLRALENLAPRLSPAQLNQAARGLSQLEKKRVPFQSVLKFERELSLDVMAQNLRREQPQIFDDAMQKKLLDASREVSERDDALLDRPFALTRGLDFREPEGEEEAEEEEEEEEDDVLEEAPPRIGPDFDVAGWADGMQKALRPVKHSALLNRVRAQTRLALLQAALGVRAYRTENKKLPGSLQVLVPAILPTLPLDPFELDTPLRYRINGETALIYSVGPDGFDDSGRAIEKVKGREIFSMESLGDILAPPELLKP